MSGTTGTATGTGEASARMPVAQRQTLLRAVAGNLSGSGRVLGPAGGWVRVDFDDIRQHLDPTG